MSARGHRLISTSHSRYRLVQQIVDRQVEKFPLAPQRDPLGQVTCRLGDKSCAQAHAATLSRIAITQPTQNARSLLQLQRQYGNRYVGRVVRLSKAGSDGIATVSRTEQSISQVIQRLPTREGRDPCRPIERDLARVGWELYRVEQEICHYRRMLRAVQACERQREQTGHAPRGCLQLANSDHYRERLRGLEARRRSLRQRMQVLRDQLRRECQRDFPGPPPVRCE